MATGEYEEVDEFYRKWRLQHPEYSSQKSCFDSYRGAISQTKAEETSPFNLQCQRELENEFRELMTQGPKPPIGEEVVNGS